MNPAKKTLLGIASFIPLALGIAYFITMMMRMRGMMMAAIQNPNDPNAVMPYFMDMFGTILALLIPMLIVSVVLLIIYIIQAVNNRKISEAERVIWIIAFIIAGAVSFPVYYFMRIYGRQEEGLAPATIA